MAELEIGAEDPKLEALLVHLRDVRGFDFSGYKRATLARRINKRMSEVSVADYDAYVDFLETNPREFVALFNTILINVTGFFRDPEAWEYLRAETIPELIAAIPAEEPIRVWSAGCASGEEAYTIAICLLEALGEDEFKRRVKIYATDVDEEALPKPAPRSSPTGRWSRSRPSCATATSSRTAAASPSARTCAARSSSAATSCSPTRRSPASTCCSAATSSCTSRSRRRPGS
jgi:hypothetical protein